MTKSPITDATQSTPAKPEETSSKLHEQAINDAYAPRTGAAQQPESRSLLGTIAHEGLLFGEGVVSGTVGNVVNSVKQVYDAAEGYQYQPTQLFSNQAEVDSSWAGRIGSMVGQGAEFAGLTMATGGLGGAGYAALAARAGFAGVVQGGLLSPSQGTSLKDVLAGRAENAAIMGASGAVAIGAGAAINGLAGSVTNQFGSAALRVGGNMFAGGSIAGGATEAGSWLATGHGATGDQIALSLAAGIAGGALSGLGAPKSSETKAETSTTPTTNAGESAGTAEAVKPAVAPEVNVNAVPAKLNGAGYPERAPVATDSSWANLDPDYKPAEYTAKAVFDHDRTLNPDPKVGWADPADPKLSANAAKENFNSDEPNIQVGADGRPLNPKGPTGIAGRGLLGKWGPNHAGDPIVTRINDDGQLQALMVVRGDTVRNGSNGQWAIPGGMVDDGELVPKTLLRELKEETGVTGLASTLKPEDATVVSKGYVVDPRNTDNAWMESTAAYWYGDNGSPIARLTPNPKGGDDAVGAQWVTLNEKNLSGNGDHAIYGDHERLLRATVASLQKDKGVRIDGDGTAYHVSYSEAPPSGPGYSKLPGGPTWDAINPGALAKHFRMAAFSVRQGWSTAADYNAEAANYNAWVKAGRPSTGFVPATNSGGRIVDGSGQPAPDYVPPYGDSNPVGKYNWISFAPGRIKP